MIHMDGLKEGKKKTQGRWIICWVYLYSYKGSRATCALSPISLIGLLVRFFPTASMGPQNIKEIVEKSFTLLVTYVKV